MHKKIGEAVKFEGMPRILFMDIETAPEIAYIWKRFKESVGQPQILHDGHLLCVAHKWANSDTVHCESIFRSAAWLKGDQYNDINVVRAAWQAMNEADIIVGHNIRQFDIATLNGRFIIHGLPPPRPYKIVDTLEALRKRIRIPSNSLETASHYFGIDTKEKQHFELWRDCLRGCPEAWKKMTAYCMNDVVVLQQLYYKLLPWMDTHPNVALYGEHDSLVCPKCGGTDFQKRGPREYRDRQTTMVSVFHRYQCKACHGWARQRQRDTTFNRDHVLTHAVTT